MKRRFKNERDYSKLDLSNLKQPSYLAESSIEQSANQINHEDAPINLKVPVKKLSNRGLDVPLNMDS